MTDRKWSLQQTAIFEWVLALANIDRFGTGSRPNLVVRARAGTGKTTTIVEAVTRLAQAAPRLAIVVSSFAKAITEEMAARITVPGVTVKGLHSLGFACILPVWKGVKVDSSRGRRLAERVLVDATRLGLQDIPKALTAAVAKLAGLLKNKAPHAADLPPDAAKATALEIGLYHEVFPTDDVLVARGWDDDFVALSALAAMQLATQRDGTIDFDDMLFLPLVLNLTRAKYDVVVVDEAQDMNVAQLELAQRLCRGSMVVVGDDRQAIYDFRGADVGSLDRLKVELTADELPLTETYRCPKSVVALAQRLVPDYRAAETNAEGIVSNLEADKLLDAAKPGDFILSRKNAPLMRTCLAFLRTGVRAKIVGRNVGEKLEALVKKVGRNSSVDGMLDGLARWEQRQIEAAMRDDNENRANEARDTADVIRAVAEECDTVDEVLGKIAALFAELVAGQPIKSVVLSSVHRAKGLEANRVFVLVDTLYPGKGAREKVEEQNIEYVAITRAKHELTLVSGEA